MKRFENELVEVKSELRELLARSDSGGFNRESISTWQWEKVYSIFDLDKFDFSEFKQNDTGNWFELPETLSGDYVGSYIGRANCQAICSYFDGYLPLGIIEVTGYYNSTQLYVNPALCNVDTAKFLVNYVKGIESYPVFDEQVMYDIEQELKEEAISDYDYDFKRELIAVYGDQLPDDLDIGYLLDEIDIRELLANVIFVCQYEGSFDPFVMENNSAYIDIKKLVQETLKPTIARKLRKVQAWRHIIMIELLESEKLESAGYDTLFNLKAYNA